MPKYSIETALLHASKAAYLATLIETNTFVIERYDETERSTLPLIQEPLYNKLNRLRQYAPKAYFYWLCALKLKGVQ